MAHNAAHLKEKLGERTQSKDRSIKRAFLKNDIEDKYLKVKNNEEEGCKPKTREELLALDLAHGLDDFEGFPLYLSCAGKYPETLLRSLLGQVKEVAQEKIKKSRGALFNYLLQKHVEKNHKHPGS
jgi:hypothetical protein